MFIDPALVQLAALLETRRSCDCSHRHPERRLAKRSNALLEGWLHLCNCYLECYDMSSQPLLPLLTAETLSASCLPTSADVAAGLGDRICILAASGEDNTQSPQQQQQQEQQLIRRFAAKVAASHRFLRFLVFKSQVCCKCPAQLCCLDCTYACSDGH